MVYLVFKCKRYFSIILNARDYECSRLVEMHELPRKDADLHVSRYVFKVPCIQGSTPEMILRFARDLEVVCAHPKFLHASCMVLGTMIPELHNTRLVCLLKAVTPAWVTNTVPFTLVIDLHSYLRFV